MCAIERNEDGKTKRYGLLNWNFNEATAKIYTDVTLFTSHQQILKKTSPVS
jgi:polyphosphate kinase